MKLDPDCMRDILLVIEEVSDGRQDFPMSFLKKDARLQQYDDQKIYYHTLQLNMEDYLVDFEDNYYNGEFTVRDLTPDGHRFLSNIQNDDNWSKTKKITHSLGGVSVSLLKTVSEGVMTELIKKSLGL